MELLDALDNPPERRTRVDAILAKLTEEEQQALQEALRSPEWPHDALARVLRDQGHGISEASIRRYRRGLK